MNRAQEKAIRILQIERLLWAHPEGLTRAEIARRVGVHRSTITKYLDKDNLPPSIYEDDLDRNLLKIDRTAELTVATFSLHEIMAIHLATRLLATRTDKQNPHAASALRKLGQALERLDRNVSRHLLVSAEVMEKRAAYRDQVYLSALEKLTEAWAAGRKVRVSHQMPDGRVFSYVLSPYFIEPYAAGQTAHVIGWRVPPGAVRTLKIERIRSVELTPEPYSIPEDFDPRPLLQDAWGIWYSEGKPAEVVLRFHPRVAGRVRESLWHPSQMLEEQANGYLVWRGRIAEVREMAPWVRGWGADVEVLGPPELRERLTEEAGQLAQLYGVKAVTDRPRALLLWGKTGSGAWDFHPAIFHMLDVGFVAAELLADGGPPRLGKMLCALFGAPEVVTDLPLMVALHDLGKISAAFQPKNSEQKKRLEQEGFGFGQHDSLQELPHQWVGECVIPEHTHLLSPGAASERILKSWRWAIGGHHGTFSSPGLCRQIEKNLSAKEPAEWRQLREEAVKLVGLHLGSASVPWAAAIQNLSAATMALCGFMILCDWLGSDQRFFGLEPEQPLESYARISRQRARKAVAEAGFISNTRSGAAERFAELFQGVQPRPLQEAIDQIPKDILAGPCIAVIEAPTGEGKTEAALALAHRLALRNGSEDFYYALPTTATSNQMYLRVQKYLRERLGLETHARLVHGQAFLLEDDMAVEPQEGGDGADSQATLEWFAPTKRALLAPFGVGTVDQVELAALNVRHNSLRMLGLAGKVIILDEVHAYDVYMSTVVERLMTWLAAMGSSVILLSATLPRARKADLVRAYDPSTEPDLPDSYPSLWVSGHKGHHHASPAPFQPERRITLQHANIAADQPEAKAHLLLEMVRTGGCACWICNTVERAQSLFERLSGMRSEGTDLLIAHARFPLEQRQHIERDLVWRYGPEGRRPERGIVVGTQVLEQSLDLDFDVMVSDLAPIDLVLQRAGRLHRHPRQRPAQHAAPCLYIACALDSTGAPCLEIDRLIYQEFILRQSWSVLSGRKELVLPEDFRTLVEPVYSQPAPPPEPLLAAWRAARDEDSRAKQEAELRLIPEPDAEEFRVARSDVQFEEDEGQAYWLAARTRLGQESITVIPLERDGNRAWCTLEEAPMDLQHPIPRRDQLRLLRRGLNISHRELVAALKALGDLPPLFSASPLLKKCHPLWLRGGEARLTGRNGALRVILSPTSGLIILKERG